MAATIFIGNPGTGKSTLINCYAGRHLFNSGVSRDGKGITFQLDVREFAGRKFMDTPGLSDIKMREAAATAIDEALRAEGLFQIVFVMTLEAGRLKPDDLTTMKLVLEAASQITENSFAILVNKCSKKFLKKVDRPAWTKLLHEACELRRIRVTHHIHFVPEIPELVDEDEEITSLDENTMAFFNSFPSIKIDAEQVQNVKVENFEEVMEQMTAMQDSLAVAERAQKQAEKKAADGSARLAEAQGDILALQKQAADQSIGDVGERSWHNDWEARDMYARQQGTKDYGCRSEEHRNFLGFSQGRIYFAMSRLMAQRQGIRLDNE